VVKGGFVHRIPDGCVFPVPIDENLRGEVRQAMDHMRKMISAGCLLPSVGLRSYPRHSLPCHKWCRM
jgi:hypothetical protein